VVAATAGIILLPAIRSVAVVSEIDPIEMKMREEATPREERTAETTADFEFRWKKQQNTREWIKAVGSLLIPLLVFWFAFSLKDSVEQAFKSKQLEVESARAIEQLLTTLHSSDVSKPRAGAAALTLASYGEAAIVPLIGVLQHGSAEAATAARHGLFMIGLAHPKDVTVGLAAVLSMRQGQFRFSTHQIAIELLGEIGHQDALKSLQEYRDHLGGQDEQGLKAWQIMVTDANMNRYIESREALARGLARFGEKWDPSGDKGGGL